MADWRQREITVEELEQNGKVSSCWLEIDGVIYDVTSFIYDHPGGEEIIVESGGMVGAGAEFEAAGHSSDAKKMLEQYAIGRLKKE
jgi:cytochrome-b5 reductase